MSAGGADRAPVMGSARSPWLRDDGHGYADSALAAPRMLFGRSEDASTAMVMNAPA